MKIIEIENSFFEELRCGICNDYLICFPLRVCTNGRVICGKCEPDGDKLFSPCQVPLLEKLLKRAKFSCKFKENGCDHELSVDLIEEHELKCVYRPCNCITKDCDWNGLLVELESHFSEEHFECDSVVEITTNWKDNYDDVLLASIESVPVVVEYKYCIDTSVLSYKISYISAYVQEASYKIYNNNESLAGGKFLCYNQSSTYEEFNIKNLLDQVLSVKITLKNDPSFILDYEKLNYFLCQKCGGYLIPFAYDYQLSGYICGLCAENSQLSVPSTKSIFKMIQNPNFPCKWNYCNFVSSANIMYKHVKTCSFRNYECPLETNCGSGDLTYIQKHLIDKHSYTFLNESHTIRNNPDNPGGYIYYLFPIKHRTLTMFTILCKNTEISVTIRSLGNSKNIPIYLEFKHKHCRISKRLCVVNDCRITMNDLPQCFKERPNYTASVTID